MRANCGYGAAVTWTDGVRRLRAVDPRLVDGSLAAVLAGGAAVQLVQQGQHGTLRWLAVMGTVLPLPARRRFPLACFWVMFVCAMLSLQPPTYAGYAALFLAVYGLGAYSTRRVLAFASPHRLRPRPGGRERPGGTPRWYLEVPAWLVEVTLGLALLLLGSSIRQLQGRAGRLEHDRELATRVAVADERARLARELRDVVAHSVSVMPVQGPRRDSPRWSRRSISLRVIDGASSASPAATMRTVAISCSGETSSSRQPLAPAWSAA